MYLAALLGADPLILAVNVVVCHQWNSDYHNRSRNVPAQAESSSRRSTAVCALSVVLDPASPLLNNISSSLFDSFSYGGVPSVTLAVSQVTCKLYLQYWYGLM